MSASSELLKQALPSTGNKKQVPVSKVGSASAALLQASGVSAGGLKYVPLKPPPSTVEKPQSLGKQILAGIVKTPARLATNLVQAGQIAVGKPQTQPFSGKFLGEVKPVGMSGNFGKDLQDAVGAGLEISSYLPFAKGISTASKLFKSAKWLKFAGPLAVEGAASGTLASGGYEISKQATTGEKINPLNIALGTALGTVAGPTLGGLFRGVGKIFGKKTTPKTVSVVSESVETKIPVSTPKSRFDAYNKSQGYEPYSKDVPVIDAGKVESKLPTIQTEPKKDFTGKIPGYKYEPIPTDKPVNVPGIKEIEPNYANVPEGPIRSTNVSARLPSTKGTTITKAADDIDVKLSKEGFNNLAPEEKAKFNSITEKEQIARVSALLSNTTDEAVEMVATGKNIPKDIHPQVLFNAVERRAMDNLENGGAEVLRRLARSPIATQESLAGQTFRASQILENKLSPSKLIAENDKSIAENILKRTGQKVDDIVKKEVDIIKAKKPPVNKQTFAEFIKDITC